MPLSTKPLLMLSLATLLALLAWDASALDLRLAHWFGGPQGFALRDDWLLSSLLHEGGRRIGWLLVLVLCFAVWWPVGPLVRLSGSRRLQFASTTLLALLVVFAIKSTSQTSCPWSLAEFGSVAQHLSHWSTLADGGPGRCFPAGHASTGFAFFGGYFVFRDSQPGLARGWLVTAIAIGLLFGFAQQARGAHFMSHTLWTGWICWIVAWVAHLFWPRPLSEQRAADVAANA
jgi:membrane-associated PAP2 superfamily phosphatase